MDTIKKKDGNFKVYTLEEAKSNNLKYKHWKDVYEGEYGLSDDGYVGKCVKRATYTDKYGRTKTNIRMCYGTQWVSNNARLLYEPNKKAGVYGHVKPTHWIDKEKNTTRAKEAVSAYVAMKMADGKLNWDKIGRIYRSDQQSPGVTAKRLFKTKEIKDMVEEKIKELLTKKGVTKDSVLDLHIEAVEMAKAKGDVSNMLKVGDVFMDLLEMKPNKKIVTDSLQLDVSSTITKALEQEDKRVLLERKVEDDEHPDAAAE